MFNWSFTFFDKIFTKIFKLSSSQTLFQISRLSIASCHDEWNRNIHSFNVWKLFLGFFCFIFNSLHCHRISFEIKSFFLFKFIYDEIHNSLIKVSTSESSVSTCRKYLKCSLSSDFQNSNIKCSTSKIKYYDLFIFIFTFSIRQWRSSWFVDNSFYLKSGDFSSCFGSISLRIVKICRNCNNSLSYFFTQIFFSVFFDFSQNKGWNLFWFIFLTIDNNQNSTVRSFFHVKWNVFDFIFHFGIFSSDESLHFIDYIFWFEDCFSFCKISYQKFITFDIDNRRGCSFSLCICNHFWFTTQEVGDTRVSCTKVNSDYFSHLYICII